MPEWLDNLTLGGALAVLASLTTVAVVTRPARKMMRQFAQIADDWNGVAERRDASGQLIAEGRPGVMAQLATVRHQVQNDHNTNLREDIDKVGDIARAAKDAAKTAVETVERVEASLDKHILIAKKSDEAQAKIAEQLAKHTPMLEDLNTIYVENRRQRKDATNETAD